MDYIKDFDQVEKTLRDRGPRKKVAIVWASDPTTQAAATKAASLGLIYPVYVGVNPGGDFPSSYVEAADPDQAAAAAVALARNGEVDAIMKGMLNTDNLLRAVLNKDTGILDPGEVLTHVTVAQIPAYHKLLLFSDAAVIPYPTDDQRHAQVRYLISIARSLGIEAPKIALTHCSEKVDPRHFPFTADYVALREMAESGQFGPCVVDGPFDVKTACSPEAMAKKGLHSALEGDSDALVFPDIEAANAFYKTLTLFAGAICAGLVVGARVPIVVPSRGDNEKSKFHSLLLASIM